MEDSSLHTSDNSQKGKNNASGSEQAAQKEAAAEIVSIGGTVHVRNVVRY